MAKKSDSAKWLRIKKKKKNKDFLALPLPTPFPSCQKKPLLIPVTAFSSSYCYISKYYVYTVISSFVNLYNVYWFPATLFHLSSPFTQHSCIIIFSSSI